VGGPAAPEGGPPSRPAADGDPPPRARLSAKVAYLNPHIYGGGVEGYKICCDKIAKKTFDLFSTNILRDSDQIPPIFFVAMSAFCLHAILIAPFPSCEATQLQLCTPPPFPEEMPRKNDF